MDLQYVIALVLLGVGLGAFLVWARRDLATGRRKMKGEGLNVGQVYWPSEGKTARTADSAPEIRDNPVVESIGGVNTPKVEEEKAVVGVGAEVVAEIEGKKQAEKAKKSTYWANKINKILNREVTMQELAAYMGVSVGSVSNWSRGQIPAKRFWKAIREAARHYSDLEKKEQAAIEGSGSDVVIEETAINMLPIDNGREGYVRIVSGWEGLLRSFGCPDDLDRGLIVSIVEKFPEDERTVLLEVYDQGAKVEAFDVSKKLNMLPNDVITIRDRGERKLRNALSVKLPAVVCK